MDVAAAYGQLAVLEFLLEEGLGSCTEETMSVAASNGHLSVVDYLAGDLDEPSISRFRQKGLEEASRRGELDIVRCLREWEYMDGEISLETLEAALEQPSSFLA